jgi:cob(I)alamin adenosyltransferase
MTEEFKIYTKTGDTGDTSLIGGYRVPKYDARIEAYGTVDELNSWIGLIRDQDVDKRTKDALMEIQDRLFTVESLLAEGPGSKIKLPEISPEDITYLEKEIDFMNETLPPLSSFILPGGATVVSYCHLGRTVCRRAERLTIKMTDTFQVNPILIKYLNRLSDYLFVLSRKLAYDLGVGDIPWKARK